MLLVACELKLPGRKYFDNLNQYQAGNQKHQLIKIVLSQKLPLFSILD